MKCVGMESVGWKLKPSFNIRRSEVVWKTMEVLLSSMINDCGEQPSCVGRAALVPTLVE